MSCSYSTPMSMDTTAAAAAPPQQQQQQQQQQSYSQMLQQAAFLNTVGVTALMSVEDSTDSCLQVFNQALALMEQVSECPTLQKVCHSVPKVWNSIQANDLRDDRFFVCSQALMFNPAQQQPSQSISQQQGNCTETDCLTTATVVNDELMLISEVDLSFYSAVVIFNMALAYHSKAMSHGMLSENPVHLENAMQLYNHCHQILTTILSPPGDDTDMLKLVTLNNQAQIHYALNNFAAAQGLLEDIKKLCPVMLLSNVNKTTDSSSSSNNGSGSEMYSFFNVQTMKEISMNALLVTGPPTAASSA